MIQAKTKNPGILAAIREVKIMGLGKNLLALYEAHMKEIRDRNAREEYVYDEGLAAGEIKGHAEGHAEAETKMQTLITKMVESGEAGKLPMLSDKAFLEEMYHKYGL